MRVCLCVRPSPSVFVCVCWVGGCGSQLDGGRAAMREVLSQMPVYGQPVNVHKRALVLDWVMCSVMVGFPQAVFTHLATLHTH